LQNDRLKKLVSLRRRTAMRAAMKMRLPEGSAFDEPNKTLI
jgi:hypothetical protein